MAYTFTTTEEDHLKFQLFQASQSPQNRKKMKRTWMYVLLLFALLGVFSWWTDRLFLAVYFGALFLISVFFYPMYLRWRYKRHFRGFVRERFQGQEEREASLAIQDGKIFMSSSTGKSEVNFEMVKTVFETGAHFFIQLDAVQYFIVPKRIPEVDQLRVELKEIGAPFEERLDWKW